MADHPDISIIIPVYNNQDDIIDCLRSINQFPDEFDIEIIVIDNASADRTVYLCRQIKGELSVYLRIIENRENTGYTKANNQGLSESRGEYVLFLNPDTRINEGFFKFGINYLKNNPATGVVAPQHVSEKNEILSTCREFPSYDSLFWEITGLSYMFKKSRVFNRWKMGYFDHNSEQVVDQPMGACLFTSKRTVDKTGYMDERFEMFFSDVDWCKKVYEAGLNIIFTPEIKIFHKMGSSVKRYPAEMIVKSHYGFYQYLSKYNGQWWKKPLNWLSWITLFLTGLERIFLAKLKNLI